MILEIETLKKFGYYPKSLKKYSQKLVVVECDICHKIAERKMRIVNSNLKRINIITCGAKKCGFEKELMGDYKEWKNKIKLNSKINKWTIIGEPFLSKNGGRKAFFAELQCECGRKSIRPLCILFTNRTKSCPNCATKKLYHGCSGTKLYGLWANMKDRCDNKNRQNNKIYTERNIKYCKEWNNFIIFKEWAQKNGYVYGLCLDRINPYKNYCPENCRWVSKSENAKWVTGYRENIIDLLEKELYDSCPNTIEYYI